MALTFHVFKLVAQIPAQRELFVGPIDPTEILRIAMSEKPSSVIGKKTWHIGNTYHLDKDAVIFSLGRISTKIFEEFDHTSGDFFEKEGDDATSTYILYESRYQICAIAVKAGLPKVNTLARYLCKILKEAQVSKEQKADIVHSRLEDPEPFLALIRSAYLIKSFQMTFRKPNPFDTDADVHKPLEKLLQSVAGVEGETKLKGEDLRKDRLEAITRSYVASGERVGASIQSEKDQPPVRRWSSGNPLQLVAKDIESEEDRHDLLKRIRDGYKRMRGG